MMRITVNGKRISFSINLFVDPKTWDQSKQRIKGNSPLTKEMNAILLSLTTAAFNTYNEHLKKNIPVEPEAVRNSIIHKNKSSTTLLEAFAHHIGNLKARIGHDTSLNTVKKYLTVEKKIKLFLAQELNRKDISLHELNHKFITDFDLYMCSREKLTHNAMMKNIQQLKRVIRICLNNEWINKDPFLNYSCKLNETERGYLTAQELSTIEQIILPNKRLEQTRDVFIFCCYTGLSYADVSKLSISHFETGVNGLDWIKINRTKTKSKSVIPILPVAKTILGKYGGTSKDKVLPIISNQNLNKYLKEIAKLCGITKRVSMHLARHTFATTVTLEKGIDISTVSRMLGHKRLSTTQIYAKVTEIKIATDMAKLM